MKINLLQESFRGNSSFKLFLLAALFLFMVNQFYMITQVTIILDYSNSSTLLGTILMLMTIPRIFILPIGGILADKLGEKNVLSVGCIILSVLLVGAGLLSVTKMLTVNSLFVLAVLFGIFVAGILPAIYSSVPKLVKKEQLQAANSILQIFSQGVLFIGPAIAGLVIARIGNNIFFLIMVCMSLIAFYLITKLSFRRKIGLKDKVPQKSSSTGFKVLLRDPLIVILLLFTMGLNVLVIGPLQVGIPILATDLLKLGVEGYGVFLSVFGLGALIGSLIAGTLSSRYQTFLTIYYLTMSFSVLWAIFSWIPNNILLAVALGLCGLLVGIINVLFITMLQNKTKKNMTGRIMSLQFLGSAGLQPVSYFFTGIIIEKITITRMYLFSGGSLIIVSSILFIASIRFFKSLPNRDLKSY